jgi:transposase
VHVGLDIGKQDIRVVLRWGPREFERPWQVDNPAQVRLLAERLAQLGQGRSLVVALEPTGTYGDPLRQALRQVGLVVHRVSPKMASDYAEIFDGVPSQHDGKDAAVVAELAAQGRCWPWEFVPPADNEAELVYWVDRLEALRRQLVWGFGRLEGLLARHWPEATRVVQLTSATLLRCLAHYGGPRGLAEDERGVSRLQRWGKELLGAAKAEALAASARSTVGVVQGPWEQRQLQEYAAELLAVRRQWRSGHRRLQALARNHPVLVAQAEVVGLVTACVLWNHLGDPRSYACGAAYRKAMGLNLAERSSGLHQGKLKISKRGSAQVRRWLYLAALRWVNQEPVRSWYVRQKQQRRGEGKGAVIGIMRKLALALYQVGGRGQAFVKEQLYAEPAAAGQ